MVVRVAACIIQPPQVVFQPRMILLKQRFKSTPVTVFAAGHNLFQWFTQNLNCLSLNPVSLE